MGVDFVVGDIVWMPGDESSRGRVFDVRDNGIEIWVHPFDGSRSFYYTYYDQLEQVSVLDLIARKL